MKKSILSSVSAAALMFSAAAVAQNNNSEVTQNGTNATATVSQGGANSESDVHATDCLFQDALRTSQLSN